jgi:hypothetical protein
MTARTVGGTLSAAASADSLSFVLKPSIIHTYIDTYTYIHAYIHILYQAEHHHAANEERDTQVSVKNMKMWVGGAFDLDIRRHDVEDMT